MIFDFDINVYHYSKCDSIVKDLILHQFYTDWRLTYFIAYKIMGALPLVFLTVFIIISLLYRALDSLMHYIRSMKSLELKQKLIEDSRDSCFCTFLNVEDDNELIFSKCDLMYVIEILKPIESEEINSEIGKKKHDKEEIKNPLIKIKSKNKSKIVNLFRTHIYDWNPNFRFTSRFINTIVVANVALYFVFLFLLYLVAILVTLITDLDNLVLQKLYYKVENGSIIIGEVFNHIDNETNISNDFLKKLYNNYSQTVTKILKFLSIFGYSTISLFMIPLFGAMVICILHMFLFIKETKKYLIELYKGKCEFVKKPKSINTESVFTKSFHFGGSVYYF